MANPTKHELDDPQKQERFFELLAYYEGNQNATIRHPDIALHKNTVIAYKRKNPKFKARYEDVVDDVRNSWARRAGTGVRFLLIQRVEDAVIKMENGDEVDTKEILNLRYAVDEKIKADAVVAKVKAETDFANRERLAGGSAGKESGVTININSVETASDETDQHSSPG